MIILSVGPSRGALLSPETARLLSDAGHDVSVYLDNGTRDFVGPASFYAPHDPLSNGVLVEPERVNEDAEALVFAPADAAVVSRLAHGLGDTPALREYVSGTRPAVVVPDLDSGTARHPAVLENLALLREDGCTVLDGYDAGTTPAGILSRTLHEIGGSLDGLRLVVTAGGTREPVDSVRFVGNRSSGKMGASIARQAYRSGAEVRVVAANVAEVEPGVEWHAVETFGELQRETLFLCEDADVLIMAAAVSDFTPASPMLDEKIRRGGREDLTLELSATPDILSGVRERCPDLFVIGFAATHGDPRPDSREKFRKKGVNMVVGNDISAPGIGFGSEENEAYITMESGSGDGYEEIFVPRGPKTSLASAILRHLKPAIKHREV
ncbi:bifunctional phosphopantothenoylcysteine decarboxylase/phosphopantothenate--cysteine ligase CoaBC [soil metagenome]